jgi:hypothetical protein
VQHAHERFLAADATRLPGSPAAGDHLQSAYRLWLFGHQLERGEPPWRDPYSFRAEAPAQASPAGWPYGLVFWPVASLFGAVVAWNAVVLLAFALAGGFTLLWLRELGLAYVPALAGGLAFALAPYRVAQSGGHLLGLVAVLLPLALWAWERGRKGRREWNLLAAAALASIPLSGQVHLALGAIPFFVLYAVCRTRERWQLVDTAVAAGIAVACGLLVREATIEGSTLAGGRSLDEVQRFSADPIDFVQREVDDGLEEFVVLGWLVPALASAGLVVLLLARRWLLATALALGVALPVALALGTNLPSYEWLYETLPPFRYPRVPERLMPVACLALAALAAFAVGAALARARGKALLPAAVLVVALVGADLRVRTGVFDAVRADEANAAYTALPTGGGLLELPVFRPDRHEGSVYLYYAMQAQRPRPLGYSTIAPPAAMDTARALEGLNCGVWRPADRALLERLGVRYVALHRGLFTGPVSPNARWFAERGLLRNGFRPVATGGTVTTYRAGRAPSLEVAGEPPRGRPILCDGWDGTTTKDEHASLWIHGGGLLVVELDASPPLRTTVAVDGARLPARVISHGSGIEVEVVGRGWHRVEIESEEPGVRLVEARFSAG